MASLDMKEVGEGVKEGRVEGNGMKAAVEIGVDTSEATVRLSHRVGTSHHLSIPVIFMGLISVTGFGVRYRIAEGVGRVDGHVLGLHHSGGRGCHGSDGGDGLGDGGMSNVGHGT